MKYVIRDTKHGEPTLRLFLEQRDDGAVMLCGEDNDGCVWYLLKIKDGEIRCIDGVCPESTGFEVDENGEIQIYYADCVGDDNE